MQAIQEFKINKDEVDSEIQPPNPVPPESQSNEKKPIDSANKVEEAHEIIEKKIENAYKASESHPRNLKTKLLNDAKIRIEQSNRSNGKSIDVEEAENKVMEQPKEEIIEQLTQVKQKIEIMKKQQLLKTMQEHNEQQEKKDLFKEQQEILNELEKTRNELQQNKKEVDSDEVKKIAVESIKKIADIAIQSLSGVSDKPSVQDNEKKSEPMENIANEALHEIAKVVGSIEAIKEKENPIEPAKPKLADVINNNGLNNIVDPVLQNNIPNQELNSNIASVLPQNNLSVINQAPIQSNVQINQKVDAVNQKPTNNVIPAASIQQEAKLNQDPANLSVNISHPIPNLPLVHQPNVAVKPQENVIPNVPIPAANIVNQDQNILVNQPNFNQGLDKAHSHSPDEPQSYKQGEDSQDVAKESTNVPLPIAKNENSQKVEQIEIVKPEPVIAEAEVPKSAVVVEKANSVMNVQANVQNNGAKDTISNNLDSKTDSNIPLRHKREVIYCTDKTLLKAEDKEICKTLIGSRDNKIQDVLPNVDLNDVLPKTLPLDTIHLMRSLKSYDEDEKKR